MSAGSIVIDLLLNSGSFETDTARASKELKKAFGEIKKTVNEVAATLGIGLGVDAFKEFISGAIETAAHLDDLSKKTGIAADVLGGIGFAAKQAGGDLESAVAGATKLNKSLAEAAAGNEKSAEAFKLLGINVKEASGNVKTADVVLGELADKFSEYEDGPNKTALALRIFGKAGADMIPVLDEGGRKLRDNIAFFQQYSGVTAETAKAANEFESALAHLTLINGAFGQQLSQAMLPTLTAVVETLLELKKAGDLQEFANSIAASFGVIVIAAASTVAAFKLVGNAIAGLAVAIPTLLNAAALARAGIFGQAIAEFQKGKAVLAAVDEDNANISKKLGELIARINGVKAAGQTANQALHSNEGYGDTTIARKKKQAPGLAADGNGGRDDFDRLLKQFQGLDATAKAAIDAADSDDILTEAQKKLAEATAQYNAKLLKLTPAQFAQVQAAAALADEHERTLANALLDKKLTAEAIAENDAFVAQQQRVLEGFQRQADAQMQLADQYGVSAKELARLNDEGLPQTAIALQNIALYGKTTDALDALVVARLRDQAATLAQRAAATPEGDAADKIRQQADAVNAQADALIRLQKAQKTAAAGFADYFARYESEANSAAAAAATFAQSAVSSLEDTLTQFLSKGKADFRGMVQAIIAEAERLYIIKPLLASIFGSTGSNGVLGTVFSALTGAGGDAGGPSFAAAAGISGGRAGGGPVGAGQAYIVGENGPEVLQMGSRSGNVIPNGGGGGAGKWNVTINAPPGTQVDRTNQSGDGRSLEVWLSMAKAAVAGDIKSGGAVHQAMASTYGVSRAAGAPRRG